MPSAPQLDWPQGQPLFEVQLRAVAEGLAGNGVVNAGDLEVSATATDLEIQVGTGTAYYDASEVALTAAETHVLSSGDGTYDRWDTIVFDAGTGSSGVREGTPERYPTPPDIQGDELLLAIVYVPSGATDISNSEILNWRATFSNEAEAVHYDDSESFYGTTNVATALNNANDLLVRRNYPANSGSLTLTEMPVDSNASEGSEQSFMWAIDGTNLLKVEAESDGSGGITGQRVRVPPGAGNLTIGDDTVNTTMDYDIKAQMNDGDSLHYTNRLLTSSEVQVFLFNATTGTRVYERHLLESGATEYYGDLILDTGETAIDYANKEVPQSFLGGPASSLSDYPLLIGTDVAAHLDGGDLLDASGGLTVYDQTNGHVPRERVDDEMITTTVTSSTYTTSGEEVVFVDTSAIGGASTITIASADIAEGNEIRVVDLTGTAATNNITVDTEGMETIDDDSSTTVEDNYGSAVFTSDGSNLAITGGTAAGTSQKNIVEGTETGAVADTDQGILIVDNLADGQTVQVQKAILTTATVEAVPSGVDLELVTFDNAGGFTPQATLISGDGSTVHDRVTGSPLASYNNASGGEQSIGVLVNNGSGTSQEVVAKVTGDII